MSGLSPIDKYFAMTPPISNYDLNSEGQGSPEAKRDSGRWTIYESQIYLDVLKKCTNTKDVVQRLREALPNRAESQIRAHHQKMIKKYGTVRKIIEMCAKCENGKMLHLSRKLREATDVVNRYKVPMIISEGKQVLLNTPKPTRSTPRKLTAKKVTPSPAAELTPLKTPVKLQPKD